MSLILWITRKYITFLPPTANALLYLIINFSPILISRITAGDLVLVRTGTYMIPFLHVLGFLIYRFSERCTEVLWCIRFVCLFCAVSAQIVPVRHRRLINRSRSKVTGHRRRRTLRLRTTSGSETDSKGHSRGNDRLADRKSVV